MKEKIPPFGKRRRQHLWETKDVISQSVSDNTLSCGERSGLRTVSSDNTLPNGENILLETASDNTLPRGENILLRTVSDNTFSYLNDVT